MDFEDEFNMDSDTEVESLVEVDADVAVEDVSDADATVAVDVDAVDVDTVAADAEIVVDTAAEEAAAAAVSADTAAADAVDMTKLGTLDMTEDEMLAGTVAATSVDGAPATKERRQPVHTLENNVPQQLNEGCGLPDPDYNPRQMRKERLGYAGTFRLADGEVVLSMYRALSGKGFGGRVYLTNRRFLMEASMHTELPIERVAGASMGKFTRIRWGRVLIGGILMLLCAALVVTFTLPGLLGNWSVFEDMGWLRYVFYGVGGIMGLIGIILWFRSMSKRFVLTVFAEGVQQVVSVRSSASSSDVDVYQAIAFGGAGPDYKLFASTFGARLIEIKEALARVK